MELLASDGMLVKRPILITDKGVTTGFREEAWQDYFIKNKNSHSGYNTRMAVLFPRNFRNKRLKGCG